ncbi:MAG: VCBS repeat-containing protein [Planctomycetota bacterium]
MNTRRLLLSALTMACAGTAGLANAVEFADPVRMEAGGEPVKVESPGYAAPCWADIDNDGDNDLLVGQFNGGKIHVFHNNGDGTLAAGAFLEAEGETAIVPGVW